MLFISIGPHFTARHSIYGDIAALEKLEFGGWRVTFENDCIGFGSKQFTSFEAAKLYTIAFSHELSATGH